MTRAKAYKALIRLIHSKTNEVQEEGAIVPSAWFAHVSDESLRFLMEQGFIEPAEDNKPTPKHGE